jgi:bleomycin hydrolase
MKLRTTFLYLPLLFSTTLFAQRLHFEDLQLIPPKSTTCTPVKDQSMSSTCWSFSSMSLLESELMKLGKGKVDLSEMFIARYSMIRKIERHLALKGGNFFTPGGQFHDAVWVMKNYGLMPEEAFPGKGRGELSHNHAEMDTILSHFVNESVENGITKLSNKQRSHIDSLLDYYYGVVPKSFTYKGKPYTAKTYLTNYLGIHPDDYVEITSYTHHPFNTKFILEDKYNWTADGYWNVSLGDFTNITNNALKNGFTVGWDGDAEDEYFDYGEGLAYLPEQINDFQLARQTSFNDKSTELDHMMHIVGRVVRNDTAWYYVKNSWGDTNGLGGFLWMREDYFKIRTLAIIVNKAAIPVEIRKRLKV